MTGNFPYPEEDPGCARLPAEGRCPAFAAKLRSSIVASSSDQPLAGMISAPTSRSLAAPFDAPPG
jgi:hypothetical protein